MKNTINNGFDSLLHSFEGLKRTKIFYKQLDDYGNISTLKGDKNIVSGFEHHQHSQNRLWFKMHSDSHKHWVAIESFIFLPDYSKDNKVLLSIVSNWPNISRPHSYCPISTILSNFKEANKVNKISNFGFRILKHCFEKLLESQKKSHSTTLRDVFHFFKMCLRISLIGRLRDFQSLRKVPRENST